ncbi:hypothetical protein [Caudoviricetes sp.]|nr:hypothetical protein [Caudoviricetes sp.]
MGLLAGLRDVLTTLGLIRDGVKVVDEIFDEMGREPRDEVEAGRGMQRGKAGHDAASNAGPKGRAKNARK